MSLLDFISSNSNYYIQRWITTLTTAVLFTFAVSGQGLDLGHTNTNKTGTAYVLQNTFNDSISILPVRNNLTPMHLSRSCQEQALRQETLLLVAGRTNIPPGIESLKHYGFFCAQENKHASRGRAFMPVFRLGSSDYVNALEGKR